MGDRYSASGGPSEIDQRAYTRPRPPRRIDGECICSRCPECRRAMKEIDRAVGIVEPVYRPPVVKVIDTTHRVQTVPKKGKPKARSDDQTTDGTSGMSRQERRAFRYSQRVLQEGRLVHPHPDCPHGRPTGYTEWGCRCEKCGSTRTASKPARGAMTG